MLDDNSTELDQLDNLEKVLPVNLLREVSQIAVAKGITTIDAINEAVAQYLTNNKFTID